LNDETIKASATLLAPPCSSSQPSTPPQPPAAKADVPPPLRPVPHTLSFSFHGSSRDYFGIWIVNTFLKIASFGIYSAWAKVRKRRFFYGSTSLQNQPFEYLADPMALFKGWLIAAGAFILYSIGAQVSPILSSVLALMVFLAFPWLLVRSRLFNAVNSSFRNIRFGFRPDYRQAYVVFAGLPILAVLTIGLLAPYMLYRQKKFMVENSTYGAAPFIFTATVKDFYILSLKVVLSFSAVVGLIAAVVAVAGGSMVSLTSAGKGSRGFDGLVAIPFVMLPLVYFILVIYVQTALANLSWNGTRFGSGNFRSTLRTRDMALLFVTNALAIMFSFGLMVPWATVRLAHYRFEHLELETIGGLDSIVAAAGNAAVGATGEEIGDMFDMPVEIAL
jgi:uncharacterized membrane protein YjgN (DUF898 family)